MQAEAEDGGWSQSQSQLSRSRAQKDYYYFIKENIHTHTAAPSVCQSIIKIKKVKKSNSQEPRKKAKRCGTARTSLRRARADDEGESH
jgi:D-arabinose 1-dehydrogenase-like Zn-dependent alcohol dehydrogenase